MFSLTHVHLLMNHVPILGSLFTTVFFIIALIFRNTFLQKVCLWVLVFVALGTAVTYATGDAAVRAVQGLPGISESMIHLHETTGKIGLGLMFVTGVIALPAAFFYRNHPKLPRLFTTTMLILLLLNIALFSYISFLGGQIHHQEIRSFVLLLKLW